MVKDDQIPEDNTKITQEIGKLLINDIETHQFAKEDSAYLLSSKWYSKFRRAVNKNDLNNFNLPIQNSILFDLNHNLKQSLINRDFKLIPASSWNILSHFYLSNDTKSTSTNFVEMPGSNTFTPNIFTIPFKVYYNDKFEIIYLNQFDHVSHLKNIALEKFNIPLSAISKTRLCFYFGDSSATTIQAIELPNDKSLNDCNLPYNATLFLEKQDPDGSYRTRSSKEFSSIQLDIFGLQSNFNGTVGLVNQGNLCYQASIIQALAHCQSFVSFLLSSKCETLASNSSKRVFVELRKLIKEIWGTQNQKFLYQTGLTHAFCREDHDFSAFTQQDAHEYLMKLIDYTIGGTFTNPSLKSTQLVPTDVCGGDSVDIQQTAKKNWDKLSKANDSPLYSCFYCLQENRKECMLCHSTTTQFEPCLSIQIYSNQMEKRLKRITYVPYSGKPIKIAIKSQEQWSLDKYRNQIFEQLGINCDGKPNMNLCFASSQYESKYTFISPEDVYSCEQDPFLAAFEIPDDTKTYMMIHFTQNKSFLGNIVDTLLYEYNGTDVEEAKSIALSVLLGQLRNVKNWDITTSGSIEENEKYPFLLNLVVTIDIKDQNIDVASLIPTECIKKLQFNLVDFLADTISLTDICSTKCPNCNKLCNQGMSIRYWYLPEILIFHFVSNIVNGSIKDIIKFTYPDTLNMDSFKNHLDTTPSTYRLTAVVSRMGSSMEIGHFNTYAYHNDAKRWILFNDLIVQPCDQSAAHNDNAYLLFYQRFKGNK